MNFNTNQPTRESPAKTATPYPKANSPTSWENFQENPPIWMTENWNENPVSPKKTAQSVNRSTTVKSPKSPVRGSKSVTSSPSPTTITTKRGSVLSTVIGGKHR